MDYNHIKNYLEKFKIILFSKEENLKTISTIIEKNTAIKVEEKYIITKNLTIYIKQSPIIKNEIMIRKKEILEDLFKILNINYKDIK